MEVGVAELDVQLTASSGPKSYNDVSVLTGDDESTDHIAGCLKLWGYACRMRGKAATQAKAVALEMFMQADKAKVSPTTEVSRSDMINTMSGRSCWRSLPVCAQLN
jgi:hypothetical protein